MQMMINCLQMETPHSVVFTGDFNCRTSQWWTEDAESPEGMTLDEIIEVNNLYQLINEPTNIRGESMSCIGLFITNPANKASIFNEYFVQQCSTIQNTSSLPTFLPRINSQLKDIAVNRDKVLKLIRTLDTKKAHGCDEISVSMIKICDSCIVEPLSMIFEKCLSTGLYPSSWKKANIIPIHKKQSRQSKKNYRPISLLPIFGKIFEKLLFDNTYEHLYANRLLSENQSGFRPGDSTVNQLLAITHKICSGFDQIPSRETRAVFLDLSKLLTECGTQVYSINLKVMVSREIF